MITTSLSRDSSPLKANFSMAVGVIRSITVRGSQVEFELGFFADETAKDMLSETEPYHLDHKHFVKIDYHTEKLAVIEQYEPEDNTASPLEQLKSSCYQWLKATKYE